MGVVGQRKMAGKQWGKGFNSSAMGSSRTQPGQDCRVSLDEFALKEFSVFICHFVMIEKHFNELCTLMSYSRQWGLGVHLSNNQRLGFTVSHVLPKQ